MSTRTQSETFRVVEPIGVTKWVAWGVAAVLAITIGAFYLTGSDRVAPTSSGTVGTEVTRSVPETSQPSGSGVPAFRTELIKGGLQPAPFAAIVTPDDVPAFEASFSGRTEGSSPSANGITLIKGGLQPRPFGNG